MCAPARIPACSFAAGRQTRMILGVFTGLLAAGGIQRMARHSAAVLLSLSQVRGEQLQLLSLNDPTGQHWVEVDGAAFRIRGFGRSKSQLAWAVLAAAPSTSVACLGHPNLAPLGFLLKVLRPAGRCKVAVQVYGTDVWEPLSLIRRLGLRLADTVAAVSEDTMAKAVVAQKIDPRRATVLLPALEPAFQKMISGKHVPSVSVPPGKMLLTVTRLGPSEDDQKGVDTVIKALPKVLNSVPEACYVVVGDGPDRDRLERLAAETGVKHLVFFVGGTTDEEMMGYYAACDVFVMPSATEGFGIAFLEAMALGKPVIGGDHGGTRNLIEPGVTGFLVKHGDIDVLADTLILLLTNEELRKRMGEAGRQCAESNYTFEHFRKKLTGVLTGNETRGSANRFNPE